MKQELTQVVTTIDTNHEFLKNIAKDDNHVLVTQLEADSESLSLSPSPVSAGESAGTGGDRLRKVAGAGAKADRIAMAFQRNIDSDGIQFHSQAFFNSFEESLTQGSALTMLPNANIDPSGREAGAFLVVDLGGSTLRVAVIQIDLEQQQQQLSLLLLLHHYHHDDRQSRLHIITLEQWSVENSFKVIDLEFFRWIGQKIKQTLQQQNVLPWQQGKIKTGVSWSFPLENATHNSGSITYMGKGYTVSPEIYKLNLKTVLEQTMASTFGIDIDIRSIVNDSIATYAAGVFLDKHMKLAMVLGTGFNACCSLNTAQLPKKRMPNDDYVLFNCELSLFGHSLVEKVSNKYDETIDARFKLLKHLHKHQDKQLYRSHMELDPGTGTIFQPSELMTGGRYLVELVRLILVDLVPTKDIFTQVPITKSSCLYQPFVGLSGKLICLISESNDALEIREALATELKCDEQTILMEDIAKLKCIVGSVIKRAAFIVATAIIGFIKLIHHHNGLEDPKFHIGYVGSVLTYFKNYRRMILKTVVEHPDVQNLGLNIELKSVEDSSLIGTAISAAYHT